MAKVTAAKVVQTKYGSYSIHYHTPEGRRRRLTVGSDEQTANRIAVKFTDWLLDGKDPEREMKFAQQREQVRDISTREFFPTFMEKHGSRQSESMRTLYHYMFSNVSRCPDLVDIPLCDIKPRLMADYMDSRMSEDRVRAATVNREATFVRCLLGVAQRRELIDRNPLHGFKLLKESPKREVNISTEQISQLIDALPESLGNIVEFAVYTGLRKDNVLSLKISQVRIHDISSQGTGGEVDLLVKGGRWETKPLKPEAVEVLKRAIGGREEGYVFIGPLTGTRYCRSLKTFDRTVQKLNLTTVSGEKLCFHDLRRIFATWMLESGVGLEAVQFFLGHRSINTTARYATYNRKVMGEKLTALPIIPRGVNKKVSAMC